MLIHRVEGMILKRDKHGKSIPLPFDEASTRCERYIQSLKYRQDGEGNQAKHFCPDCVNASAKRREAALAMVRVGI